MEEQSSYGLTAELQRAHKLEIAGKKTEALTVYQQILAVHPDDDEARRGIGRLNMNAPPSEKSEPVPSLGELIHAGTAQPAAEDIPAPASETSAEDIPAPASETSAEDIPAPTIEPSAEDIPAPTIEPSAEDIPASATEANDESSGRIDEELRADIRALIQHNQQFIEQNQQLIQQNKLFLKLTTDLYNELKAREAKAAPASSPSAPRAPSTARQSAPQTQPAPVGRRFFALAIDSLVILVILGLFIVLSDSYRSSHWGSYKTWRDRDAVNQAILAGDIDAFVEFYARDMLTSMFFDQRSHDFAYRVKRVQQEVGGSDEGTGLALLIEGVLQGAGGRHAEVIAEGAGVALGRLGIIAGLYFLVLMMIMKGQTIGKKLLGLRVVKENGDSLSVGTIFLRSVFGYAASSLFLLGFIWGLVDRDNRAWHDMLAGTRVIRA